MDFHYLNVDPIKQLLLHGTLASAGKCWAQTSHNMNFYFSWFWGKYFTPQKSLKTIYPGDLQTCKGVCRISLVSNRKLQRVGVNPFNILFIKYLLTFKLEFWLRSSSLSSKRPSKKEIRVVNMRKANLHTIHIADIHNMDVRNWLKNRGRFEKKRRQQDSFWSEHWEG